MGIVIFLIALFAIALVIGINSYNALVRYCNRYKNAYSQIDVQLQRRYELIPNLVETAKGYIKHERETLEAVVAARSSALNASHLAAKNPGDPEAMEQLGNAETLLKGSLERFMVVVESYPDLKANQTMNLLMEELSSTENRVAFARQAFNDAVTLYNTACEAFPSNILAQTFNFTTAELLLAATPEMKTAPKVSF